MTRKHFIELAAIVRKYRYDMKSATRGIDFQEDVLDFCAKHNSNFNPSRFRNACGPTLKPTKGKDNATN